MPLRMSSIWYAVWGDVVLSLRSSWVSSLRRWRRTFQTSMASPWAGLWARRRSVQRDVHSVYCIDVGRLQAVEKWDMMKYVAR